MLLGATIAFSFVRAREALTFGAWRSDPLTLAVCALIVGGLVRYCSTPDVTTGDIFAVFRYVLMFVMALDGLPGLVRHVSQLRDVARRVSSTEEELLESRE